MSDQSAPGGSARAWVPCKNKVKQAGQRCAECDEILRTHPHEAVRAAYATDPLAHIDVLKVLSEDGSLLVSLAAKDALQRRRNGG